MRIDFYTHPHKKQRNELFALSSAVAAIDFTNTSNVAQVYTQLIAVIQELREHVFNEETFVHPLLAQKIPSSEKALHHEHSTLEKYLDDLTVQGAYLKTLKLDYPKCQQQGLEFYRSLNRFIAAYLTHINEEEYIMQNLWEVAADAELIGIMTAFQTYDGKEKGKNWLVNYFSTMSLDEQKMMIQTTELLVPASVFATLRQLAEQVVGAERWALVLSGA